MLSQDEERYIQTIPEDKTVVIQPYDPLETEIAEELIVRVKNIIPELKIEHMGASGLKISGQGDLDIYMLAKADQFPNYLPQLKKLFGDPTSQHETSIAWNLIKAGFPVELYLTDPDSKEMSRQVTVFETLKSDSKLLDQYEQLKSEMNGKPFREYQKKKYEFYHQILNES